MKVRFAALADAVLAQQDGKLNVIGLGIDIIKATSYPYVHPTLSVLFMLTFDPDEIGKEQKLQMLVVTPGGLDVPPANFEMTPKPPDYPDLPVRGSIIAAFNGFPFEGPGVYVWRLIWLNTGATIGEASVKALPPPPSGD